MKKERDKRYDRFEDDEEVSVKPKNRVMCPDCGKSKMLFETEKKAENFIKWNGDKLDRIESKLDRLIEMATPKLPDNMVPVEQMASQLGDFKSIIRWIVDGMNNAIKKVVVSQPFGDVENEDIVDRK